MNSNNKKRDSSNQQNDVDKNPYEDIIDLSHHVSTKHKQMTIYNRAAQFSPFAALTGFEGEIKETARLTNQRIELTESEKSILDEKLRIVRAYLQGYNDKEKQISITYYQPDEKKSGGSYITVKGTIKKVDEYKRILVMGNKKGITIDDIVDMVSDLFWEVEDL